MKWTVKLYSLLLLSALTNGKDFRSVAEMELEHGKDYPSVAEVELEHGKDYPSVAEVELEHGKDYRSVAEVELERRERNLNAILQVYTLNVLRVFNNLKPYIHSRMTVAACERVCKIYGSQVFPPWGHVVSVIACRPLCDYALRKLEEMGKKKRKLELMAGEN